MTYAEKLLDPRWQKRRLKLFEAANWTCQECSTETRTLHAHHGYYKRKTEPWDYPDEVMHVLCVECHEEMQTQLEKLHSLIALQPALHVRRLVNLLEALPDPAKAKYTLETLTDVIMWCACIDLWADPPEENRMDYEWLMKACLSAAADDNFRRGWDKANEVQQSKGREHAATPA